MLSLSLSLLERGYEIDICAAQAARDEDRRRILNAIRNCRSDGHDNIDDVSEEDLQKEQLDLTDPAFAKVSKVLRGIYAEAAARKAAEAGRLNAVVDALKEDTERTKLTLNLGGCQ